jgi:hypothetical protein
MDRHAASFESPTSGSTALRGCRIAATGVGDQASKFALGFTS